MLPERIDRVRDLCAGWVKGGHTPSIVALVARRGVVVFHEAFGKLRPEEGSPPLRVDSLFPVSSITKPVTATLILCLVEDGLLGLNRPVVDYIPELSGEGTADVLVHHLLTHTSGFNDETILGLAGVQVENPGEAAAPWETRRPIQDTLERVFSAPVWKAPGEEMSYCTHNFVLLGEIAERVSGRSFDDLARERLFEPLGMSESYLRVPEAVRSRVVKWPPTAGFAQPIPGFWQGLNSREMEETPWADRGLYSTARDLAVYGQTFLNGGSYGSARILSRPSVVEMTRNQIPGMRVQWRAQAYKEASYGFGWFTRSNEKWRYLDGSLPPLGGFHHYGMGGTLLWVDPTTEIVGVYLSVNLEHTPDFEPLWCADLFQNAVTAAVAD